VTATQTPPLLTITNIEAAASAIDGRIDNIPFLYSETLSEITAQELLPRTIESCYVWYLI